MGAARARPPQDCLSPSSGRRFRGVVRRPAPVPLAESRKRLHPAVGSRPSREGHAGYKELRIPA